MVFLSRGTSSLFSNLGKDVVVDDDGGGQKWVILGVFGYFGGTKNGTSGARIKILRPLFNTNTPPKTLI